MTARPFSPRALAAVAALATGCVLSLPGERASARPAPSARPGPSVEDVGELNRWIKERAARAQSGKPELVRVPVAFRSRGWGCECPQVFIGTSPHSHNGGDTWVSLSAAAGVTLPQAFTRDGAVKVVEGTFSGGRITEDMRNAKGEPEDWLYHLWGFSVLRLRFLREGVDDRVQVVLDAAQLAEARSVPPLKDDRPWLVVAGSFPISDKRSAASAEALRKKLVEAGLTAAEILDGRRAPLLFCCYQVVVASRHTSRAEALAAARTAGGKRLRGITVRRGW